MSKDDGHKIGRRELANKIAGTTLGVGVLSQALYYGTGSATATTQGDATFQNTEPYVLDDQKEITIVSRLDCLDSVYVSEDDTWNHKFDFANQGAARDANDDSTEEYVISNHGLVANNNGTDIRWASYSDPSVTGAVPPTGSTDEEMTFARDAIETAAGVMSDAVGNALTAVTIFEDMVAVATESAEEDPDRFKFEWAYSFGDKSDVSNQCKFWATHDGGKAPDFTLDSQVAQVYNNFFVTLGDSASTFQGSFASGVSSGGPPEGDELAPVPRPQNMSKKEKKRYGVKRVSRDEVPDLPPEASESGPLWRATDYPVNIFRGSE